MICNLKLLHSIVKSNTIFYSSHVFFLPVLSLQYSILRSERRLPGLHFQAVGNSQKGLEIGDFDKNGYSIARQLQM